MPTTCQINFENNPHRIVFSGQKLYITVRLKLTEEIKVRSIYIHLNGTAHVRFIMDTTEEVLDIRKCLTDENGEVQVLPVGIHDYMFSCTLPRELPSSFSGSSGCIKYTATVVLHIPLWPDKKYKQKFFVFKPFNLNDMPSLRTEVSRRKSEGLLLQIEDERWEWGSYTISARIPTGGYAHGQNIDLEVTVNNNTTRPIKYFFVYILRRTVYEKFFHKTEDAIGNKKFINDWVCEEKTNKTFPTVSITVPAMIPPTNPDTSKIIKVKYFVSIEGFYFRDEQGPRISVDLPITIGTIPFYDSTSDMTICRTENIPSTLPVILEEDIWLPEPLAPIYPDDDTVSIRTYTSTPPPFPEDDFDLPTYEEALLMDQDIDVSMQKIQETFTQLCIQSTRN